MPKPTTEKLHLIFTSGGSLYPLYKDSVDQYNELKTHADGAFPEKLIAKRRPSESDEVFLYRKETYEPITKLPLSKAITCYGKIRRSPDWMIGFRNDQVPNRILPEETLEKYCTEKLPGIVSLTNWAFDILLPQNLIDANAVIAVIPLTPILPDVFAQPVPILFHSDQVMYYNEIERWCVLMSRTKISYLDAGSNYKTGNRFYYIDDKEILAYDQDASGWSVAFQQVNTIGMFPVFRVKSEAYKQYDNMSLNRSRLHAMVPFLNKAAAGDSDLEGSKVMHLFPKFWYLENDKCNDCGGMGKIAGEQGEEQCKTCNGSGSPKFSPYAHLKLSKGALEAEGSSFPIPPAGYVTMETGILELQDKLVEKNCYKALAALNMQFLDQTPLSISGDAKQVDREELNNTVYNTAEDIVYALDKVVFLINEWRYKYFVPDDKERRAMLPNIPVPETFDLLPVDYLVRELEAARNAKANPLIIGTLEQQIASKKFYNKPELASQIQLLYDLDPLPGMSVDEKMTLLSNKGITVEDYVISSYMASFIKRALRADPDFCKKTYDEQMQKLKEFAQEKITANDSASQLIASRQSMIIQANQPVV